MNNPLYYRLSLGLTILLTVVAFFTLLGWFGTLINGLGKLPFSALVPWLPLILLALAALNCTFRARVLLGKGKH
jgi:hypothetical protein